MKGLERHEEAIKPLLSSSSSGWHLGFRISLSEVLCPNRLALQSLDCTFAGVVEHIYQS